jgi:hypothetical protein
MALPDDYRDEMDALSPEQIESVLDGRSPGEPAAARVAAMVDDLRRALVVEPSPEVAHRHLAEMSAAAGLTGSRRSSMRTRRRFGVLALAAALTLGGGLAAALTLPEQADDRARERVPEDVPQGPPEGVPPDAADHGRLVSETARDDSLSGCEKGLTVAGVASEGQADPPPDACAGGEDGATVSGNGGSSFGRSTADEARADGQGFGEGTSEGAREDGEGFGRTTAEEAGGGTTGGDGAETGTETSSGGRDIADEAASGGQAIGDQASEGGRGTADEASGDAPGGAPGG